MTETNRTRSSSGGGPDYQGINERIENLLQTFNIPMDCYLLTTLISTNFDAAKFSLFFYNRDLKFSILNAFYFILILPIMFLVFFSGLIVFFFQAFILYLFVSNELEAQSSTEETIDFQVILSRVVLIIVFSMMILPDYQNSVKKIVIGIKTPKTTISFKLVTICMSMVQLSIALIVISGSIFVIRSTSDISDLLQNFAVLYIIIQIDEVTFTFLCISNILSCLKILGFRQEIIKRFKTFNWPWKSMKRYLSRKKEEKEKREMENAIKQAMDISIIISQYFLLAFLGGMSYFLMTVELSDL